MYLCPQLTTIKYVEYCEEAWLLLRLRNYASALADKESNCKYYFIDTGILGLFLIDKDAMLLENLVAIQLFRIYGHDIDNGRVFFYHDGYEVDFYIPDDELAIQVCYSLHLGIGLFSCDIYNNFGNFFVNCQKSCNFATETQGSELRSSFLFSKSDSGRARL